MTAPRSAAQVERQRPQHRSAGRYAAFNACEACGKSAGKGYFSWSRLDEHGVGTVLCEPCADHLESLTEDEALAALLAGRAKRRGT